MFRTFLFFICSTLQSVKTKILHSSQIFSKIIKLIFICTVILQATYPANMLIRPAPHTMVNMEFFNKEGIELLPSVPSRYDLHYQKTKLKVIMLIWYFLQELFLMISININISLIENNVKISLSVYHVHVYDRQLSQ